MRKPLVLAILSLTIVAVSPITAKKPAKSVQPKAIATPFKNHPYVGSYMLKNGDKWDGSTKFVLDPTGQFRFAGTGWMSKGTFTIQKNLVKLNWTEVDGKKQKPGAMTKTLLFDETRSFVIDQYKYFKRT